MGGRIIRVTGWCRGPIVYRLRYAALPTSHVLSRRILVYDGKILRPGVML